jgi:hypothetical protein
MILKSYSVTRTLPLLCFDWTAESFILDVWFYELLPQVHGQKQIKGSSVARKMRKGLLPETCQEDV